MITPRLTRRELVRRLTYGIAFTVVSGSLLEVLGCQQEPEASTDSSTPGVPVQGKKPAATFPPKPEGTFKIGLITPGSTQSDTAWSKPAYDGVQKIAAETGATVTPPIESPAPAEVEGALRNLAQDGNQLIFLHGSEYDEAAAAVAPVIPGHHFCRYRWTHRKAPNMTPIQVFGGRRGLSLPVWSPEP